MTRGARQGSEVGTPLLQAWSDLEDDEDRAEFLASNSGFGDPRHIDLLCAESARLAKSDLPQAMKLARAAERLADLSTPPRGRGRALRALANVTHLQGRYHEAADLYAQALARFQGRNERLEEAVTRSSAIHNLIYLSDYERARQWAGQARKIFEDHGDFLRLARLELNYANVLYRKDRWEEALELYESAYRAFGDLGAAEDLAACLINQATCLVSLNRFFEALRVYKQARQLCYERDWPLLIAEVDYNIAHLYFLRGDYTRALEQYQGARRRAGAHGDQLHLGLCDLDQSEIYIELNLLQEAVLLASRAYERFVLLGLRYEAGKALTNLAIGNSRQGKTFLALDLLTKAREIFVEERNEIWPGVLDLYRATLLFAEGRLFEAARLARTARAAFDSVSVPSKTAACEILLAKISCDSGDPRAAYDAASEALALLRSLNLPALSYQAHMVLGQTEEARGNRSEAEQAYRAARVWLERTRGHRQPEDLKIGLSEDRLLVYESLVSLTMQQDPEDSSALAKQVFELAENAKARNLANLIAFRASTLPAKAASRSALVGDIRSLREELNWYYRQIDLGQMATEEETRKRVGPLRETSRQQEQKLVRTLSEIGVDDAEFSALQGAGTVEVDSIRSCLPADTALLEYYSARGAVFGIVLTSERFEVLPLSLISRTRDLHRDLQFQLSRFLTGQHENAGPGRPLDAGTLQPLEQLYDELMAPLIKRSNCSDLVIVPHGHMQYLPFHALFDGAGFAGDQHTISYAPSAGAFQRSRAKERTADNRIVFVDPGGDEPALEEWIEALEPLGAECETLHGDRATPAGLESAGSPRILHLATDVRPRQDNPMFSSLGLAESSMSFFDLYGLECQADLVVLTGCGASLDVLTDADELVALANGLLYAGAKAVALELWNPNGAARAALWRSFYRRIAAGERTAVALQSSIQGLRKSHAHPFQWAPTVLIGDPN